MASVTDATGTTTDDVDGVGARRGGYYYAHGCVATDPNFAKPKKITAEEAAIVEEANDSDKKGPSAWNVNDYHWEEKDKTPWAKYRLNELLGNINVTLGKKGTVTVTSVDVDGFLCVNVRKGKLIPLFELTLKIHWTGTMIGGKKNGNTVVEGIMCTRELNHEDAAATKDSEDKTEELDNIWLEKTATCHVVSKEDDYLSVKDQTAVDRVLRHQGILNVTFMKKCLPKLKAKLNEFLEEVRVK
jgi:hypothetical protein